ncbi:YkyB family protein [Aquibacillus salsiterrae]|uniref:YkyB family protein n=1 Tax=Aquibacillus salsiterrae TaxID=2950439 RepID=A0A9X3WBY4_9BACI|nr:YkyB family protein [Aquibacillus salsiterrae]MDC3416547.1 YkyB family protein [Aquibacillus salsiterrae]
MSEHEINNIDSIAKALFVVNRHAKTAPNPRYLYDMKKEAITKLIKEKHAFKIGLHFSDHPKLSHQHSTVLVKVSDYYFHILPSKEDFKLLKHLGKVDSNYRNPKPQMSLSHAKKILCELLGWSYPPKSEQKQTYTSYFTPSSLGQMSGHPYNKRKWRY